MTTNPPTQYHFARFERKYLIPEQQRDKFENELKQFVEFDPFTLSQAKNKYFVRSLYYDDAKYSSYRETVRGVPERFKFRVRTYSPKFCQSTPVFLELKGKKHQLVYKHRTQLHLSNNLNPTDYMLEAPNGDDVKEQFFFNYYRKDLRPVALVDYQRRAFRCRHNSDVRLTIDDNIEAFQTRDLEPKNTDVRRQIVLGHCVLEIKFLHAFPAWFQSLVDAHGLTAVSLSKICKSLEALGLQEEV